jgi:D-alanine-D-alanine ligase
MILPNGIKGVLVFYNDSQQMIKGEELDIISEQDVVNCARGVQQALLNAGIRVEMAPITGEAEDALAPYDPAEWVVFNLAEGLGGRLYEESRIASLLESRGFFFTGSSGTAIARSLNKALAKSILSSQGLSTPAWRLFHSPEEVPLDISYPFPLIVKPVGEDASLGIGKKSVVSSQQDLREQVAYIVEVYKQSALVEEFIAGREFNAAAWGDPLELLPLAEIDFSGIEAPEEQIVNYSAKWQEDTFEYHHTKSVCPANINPRLNRKISEAAIQALTCLEVQGYGRVDIRLNNQEIPYILEINCNPDISAEAGFFNAARSTGSSYQEMVLKILSLARRPSDEYCEARIPLRWVRHPEYLPQNSRF